jgi:hypothetical protein
MGAPLPFVAICDESLIHAERAGRRCAQDAAQGALQRRPGGGWCVVSPCGEKRRQRGCGGRVSACYCAGVGVVSLPPANFRQLGRLAVPTPSRPISLRYRCRYGVTAALGFPLRRGVGSDTQGAASLDSNALAALNGSRCQVVISNSAPSRATAGAIACAPQERRCGAPTRTSRARPLPTLRPLPRRS